MNPHEFLERVEKNWPLCHENVFAALSPEDVKTVREIENKAAHGEFLALTDIVLNCGNRFAFAKSYKVLWDDFRKSQMDIANSGEIPELKKAAIISVLDTCLRYKLRQMAIWFEIKFADASDRRQVSAGKFENAIDIYAGREGVKSGGCAASLLLLLIGGSLLYTVSITSM